MSTHPSTEDITTDRDLQPLVFSTLRLGERVVGATRVTRGERVLDRTGAPYHRLTLTDRLGAELSARRFAVGDEPAPPAGSIVQIVGILEHYRDAPSLTLERWCVASTIPITEFLPHVPASRVATLADLDELIDQITDPGIRSLVATCLGEGERSALATHPAAVRHHGAAVGGLLAHTVRVARTALTLRDVLAPMSDRDVVLAGALLHDLGKLEELFPEPGVGFTEVGTLLGHVGLGVIRVAMTADRIPALTSTQRELVLHALAAAHGKREHGALVLPATLEATLVHLADLAEARLTTVQEARERAEPGAAWTTYLPQLQTRLRLPGRA